MILLYNLINHHIQQYFTMFINYIYLLPYFHKLIFPID